MQVLSSQDQSLIFTITATDDLCLWILQMWPEPQDGNTPIVLSLVQKQPNMMSYNLLDHAGQCHGPFWTLNPVNEPL